MPSIALACLVTLIVSTVTRSSPAQDLRTRLDAAAANQYEQELAALLAAPAPLTPIVDALVADRTRTGFSRARPFRLLASTRRSEVEALWHAEPDARIARGRLFAELGAMFLLERHVQGREEEQIHAAAVATYLPPYDCSFLQILRNEQQPKQRRRSADLMQRTIAHVARNRPHPTIDMLRVVRGTPSELDRVYLPHNDQFAGVSAFHLSDLLTDEDQVVRTRAMAMLRLSLRQSLPDWLASALRCDPAPNVRAQAVSGAMTTAELDWLLSRLAANDPHLPVPWNDVSRLSAKDVERLAAAMIASAARRPLQLQPAPGPRGVNNGPRGPGERDRPTHSWRRPPDADRCFQAAAALGPRFAAAVVATAVNAPSPDTALSALCGLEHIQHMDAATAEAVAPVLATLLDHEDTLVAFAAARIATKVVAASAVPVLRERVVAIAQHALANGTLDTVRPSFGCGMGPGPPPVADSAVSQIVFAAAVAGDQRVTCALLDRWRAPHDGDDGEFALLCLERLASGMAPEPARELHGVVSQMYSAPRGAQWRRPVIDDVLNALFVSVPDEVLPWYRDHFGDESRRSWCAARASHQPVPLSRARTALLLDQFAGDAARQFEAPARLYFDAPERVAAAWRLGGPPARAAANLVSGWWRDHPTRVAQLVAGGALPRDLAASTVISAYLGVGLPVLAAIQPAVSDPATEWATSFATSIERAPLAEHALDLDAISSLVTSPHPIVALAAARRTVELGPLGVDLAHRTLTRQMDLAGEDLERVKLVAAVCAAIGVRVEGLQPASVRLRNANDARARMLADAIDLRFFGLHPAVTDSPFLGEAIAAARIDVDALMLRCALRNGMPLHHELTRLLRNCSQVTMTSGLELAATMHSWSTELESRVTDATLHTNPRVRRAAYLALRSRDRELVPCAWLTCEAAFDPDPSVRDAAR